MLFGGQRGGVPARNDHIDLAGRQLINESRQTFQVSLGASPFEHQVRALCVPQLLEAPQQRSSDWIRIAHRRPSAEGSNAKDLGCGLGECAGPGRKGCTAKQGDEFAASHVGLARNADDWAT